MDYYTWDKKTDELKKWEGDILSYFQHTDGESESAYRVGYTEVVLGILVSTVFLRFDHGHGSDTPLLFETMVFSDHMGVEDEYQERYWTAQEARDGHIRAVKAVEEQIKGVRELNRETPHHQLRRARRREKAT